MSGNVDRQGLKERLLGMIEGGEPIDDDAFDDLALEIFRYQTASNAIYRRYCERRGATPSTVRTWLEIPAIPTDAFKAAPLHAGAGGDVIRTFRTSGTTQGSDNRGEHHFIDLDLYRASLLRSFRDHLVPDRDRIRMLCLVPRPDSASDSSLGYMISEVADAMGATVDWAIESGQLNYGIADRAATDAAAAGEPLAILGTSFAFVHLLDAMAQAGRRWNLPEGSRVMDTGGFKGRSREVPRGQLYAMISDQLDTEVDWIVNEYGMTEMSSQFYDGVVGSAGGVDGRLYRSASWVRTVAVDPETLRPLATGEVGILRHIDLANLDSVAALQTADLGRISGEGMELFGRNPGAEPRGCSIAMDDVLLSSRTAD